MRRERGRFLPPAPLEGTEATEEERKIIMHAFYLALCFFSSSVVSVPSSGAGGKNLLLKR
jgi:hypothetical protein